jgi:hypothetical protein
VGINHCPHREETSFLVFRNLPPFSFLFFSIMVDAVKEARKSLQSIFTTYLLPAYSSPNPTATSPATNLIGLLALVLQQKSTLFAAQMTGINLLTLITARSSASALGVLAEWFPTISTSMTSAITTDAHLASFFTALGAGGANGLLADEMGTFLANFLFPSPGSRLATVRALLLITPHPERANTYLVPILSALWGVAGSVVSDLVYDEMLSPTSDYPLALANSLLVTRSEVVSELEPVRTAVAANATPDFKNLYRRLQRLAPPVTPASSAVALGAVQTPPAPAAAVLPVPQPELLKLQEQINALQSQQKTHEQSLHKAIVGAIAKGFLQQSSSSSSSPSSTRPKCSHCGKMGHLEATCFKKHPHLKKYASSSSPSSAPAIVGTLQTPNLLDDDEFAGYRWPRATSLQATVTAAARVSSTGHEVLATLDTGAPFSALSPAVALRLGCVVSRYKGPPLHGPDGRPLRVVGQTVLAKVTLGTWSSVVGPLAVIEGLEWDLLFGLRDLSRCSYLHINFSVTPPAVTLGDVVPTSAPSPPPAVVGSVSTGTLSAVSAIAASADARLRAADEVARAHAVPVPIAMGARAASVAKPAVVHGSADETARRDAFHARHTNAYREVEVDASAPKWFQEKVRALLKRRRKLFAVRETDRSKPPVIDCSQPGVYPLELFLKAGQQATTQAQPLFTSRKHASILQAEHDAILRDGRAEPARRALAIAPGFVTDDERVVFDYGNSNGLLYTSAHTLPSTDRQVKALAAFDGACYFSFDLRDGFAQWPLAEGCGAAACINIGGETLEPKVASMGVHCVPGEFHALVSRLFKLTTEDYAREPLLVQTLLETFLDDGAGAAKSYEALYALLDFAFDVCARVGFTLNARKTRIGMRSLIHAGVLVCGPMLRPLTDYVEAIRRQARPVDRAGLDRFLGQCGWVTQHLVDVFDQLAELRRMATAVGSAKRARLRWSSAQADAFRCVHAALADPRALYAFDPAKTVFSLTDADDYTGVCLVMQLHTIKGVPTLCLVAAVGHSFTVHELKYSTPEKELAAFRYGRQRLEHLLLGRTVIWLTDNLSMAKLLEGARISTRRRLRTTWLDLQGIRVIAVHIAGKLNTLADALSRNPRLSPAAMAAAVDEEAPFEISYMSLADPGSSPAAVAIGAFRPATLLVPTVSPAERVTAALARAAARVSPVIASQAAELQQVDESLEHARLAAASGERWLDCRFAYGVVGELRLLFAQLPAAVPHPSVDPDRRWVLAVPLGMRQPVLEAMHAATAHGAYGRLIRSVVSAFWWPTVRQDLRALIGACDACMRARRFLASANFGNIESDPSLVPTRSGQMYEIDCWTWPLFNGKAMRLIAAVDTFDGFVVLELLDNINSAAAAKFARRLHDTFGAFDLLRTDGAPEFRGHFSDFVKRLKARHRRGTPYNSNSQSRIERVFVGFNDLVIKQFTHNPAASLLPEDIVSVAAFALNNSWSRPTPGAPASTAFERKYGRPSPLSLLVASSALPDVDSLLPIDPTIAQFVLALANESTLPDGPPVPYTQEARIAARLAQEARSARTVAAEFGPSLKLKVGDSVFLRNDNPPMGKISKVVRQMLGPFVVTHVSGGSDDAPLLARIAVPGSSPILEADVFVRNLAPCGPQLNIDSPMLRLLPPTGFFVAELMGDDSTSSMLRLQALAEQSLEPAQRARVQALRLRERRTAFDNERLIDLSADADLADQIEPPVSPMSVSHDESDVDDDDDDDDDAFDDAVSDSEDDEAPGTPSPLDSPPPAGPRVSRAGRVIRTPLRLREGGS